MARTGRPKIVIDDKFFDQVIALPLIEADIASLLKCSIDTLDRYCKRRFSQTFAVLREQNKNTFRRNIVAKQYQMAMKGDRVMLIWLGKQYCGQQERIKTETDSRIEIKELSITELRTRDSELERELIEKAKTEVSVRSPIASTLLPRPETGWETDIVEQVAVDASDTSGPESGP